MSNWQALQAKILAGERVDSNEALLLADIDDTAALVSAAGRIRDQGHDNLKNDHPRQRLIRTISNIPRLNSKDLPSTIVITM